MNLVTWINTVVGIVGIIVGIIGWKSLSTAIKINNTIKANTVQQAQIIHNGLDDYAVIRISREATKEELKKVIDSLQLAKWEEEIDGIVTEKVNNALDERIASNEEIEELLKQL